MSIKTLKAIGMVKWHNILGDRKVYHYVSDGEPAGDDSDTLEE
jgi:hypothetical protein